LGVSNGKAETGAGSKSLFLISAKKMSQKKQRLNVGGVVGWGGGVGGGWGEGVG